MSEQPRAKPLWRSWANSPTVHLAGLVGAAVIAYSNSFHVPFVFDDYHVLIGNPIIENFRELLGKTLLTRSRSLVDLTFALQWHLHGQRVVFFHGVNLLIHCVNGILAYFVAGRLFHLTAGREKELPVTSPVTLWPAFVAAAFFLLHPVQTQAVTYITQRYTSLMALFYLAAVWAFLRFRENGRLGFGILVCGCAYGAFLCKQNALTLPLSLLAMEVLLFTGHRRFWVRWGPWILMPASLALVGILWNVGLFSGTHGAARDLLEDVDRFSRETLRVSRTSYFYTQLTVLCRYIGLVLVPLHQCVDPQHPFVHRFFEGWTLPAAGLLVGLLTGAWWIRRRAPLVSLGVLWFFSTLSLESSIIPIRDAMFEHRLYLAVAGFGWILAWILSRPYGSDHRIPVIVACTVLVLLGAATYQRNRVWQDPVALWNEAAACNPRNARALNNLGRHLIEAGRLQEAEKALVRALAVDPFRPNVYFNLGMVAARTQRLESAFSYFSTAIALDPRKAAFYQHLGMTFHRMGMAHRARECYEAALLHAPKMQGPAMNLAALAYQAGQYEEARQILEDLTRRFPKNAKSFYYLSLVFRAQGRHSQALEAVEKALNLEPENFEALLHKAVLLMDARHGEEAMAILRLLKERHPQDERVSFYLDKLSPPGAQEERQP